MQSRYTLLCAALALTAFTGMTASLPFGFEGARAQSPCNSGGGSPCSIFPDDWSQCETPKDCAIVEHRCMGNFAVNIKYREVAQQDISRDGEDTLRRTGQACPALPNVLADCNNEGHCVTVNAK